MAFSKVKTYYLLAIIFFVIIFTNACKKYYVYNYQHVFTETKKYIFMPGSQWVYKADISNNLDTVTCISLTKDTFIYDFIAYKGDNNKVLNEYYKMDIKHSYDQRIETHYFYLAYDRVNGGISKDKFYGQLYLNTDSNRLDRQIDSSGFISMNDTSIYINSINYFCNHAIIISAEQTEQIYNYNTDIYFVKSIGLVKRFDQYEGWSLLSYQVYPVNY